MAGTAGAPAARGQGPGAARIAVDAVLHIAKRLLHSRLLLAYVVLGLISGFRTGLPGLAGALVNYALLALYVLVIYLWTRSEPTLADQLDSLAPSAPGEAASGNAAGLRGSRPRDRWRDLALVALVFAVTVGYAFWVQTGGPLADVRETVIAALQGAGWNPELARNTGFGVANSLGMLLPVLVLAFAFGLRPRQFGLLPRRLDLGLFLLLLGIGFAGLSRLVGGQSTPLWTGQQPPLLVLGIFVASIFVYGLPEELAYRGVIVSRLVPWLKNPHNAFVISSVLFVAFHIPSALADIPAGVPVPFALLVMVLTPGPYPTGLVWAYLVYRTRSIWPGVLWHTSSSIVGTLFIL